MTPRSFNSPPPCDPLVSYEDMSRLGKQSAAILKRLRQGRATSKELADICLSYTWCVSDLRLKHGFEIKVDWKRKVVWIYDLKGFGGKSDNPVGWNSKMQKLLGWYASHRDRFPSEPFELSSGVRVLNVREFLISIDRDILAGPNGPRSFCGALQYDLTRLRELFAGNAETSNQNHDEHPSHFQKAS